MDESISSGGGRGKNKRFWTMEEDNILVVALFDLSADPYRKCDNGFRNGYMNRLEEVIGKAIHVCGLKASPHIDSRTKTLVAKFRAIVQMLNTSGFKWDDDKHMISVERNVYDEYCKIHPNCKNLYGRAFPYLNTLMEIYGKDYATGKSAEGFVDAIGNMEKTVIPNQVMLDSSDDEDINASDAESAPPSKKMKRDNNSKQNGGKKKGNANNSELASLQVFMKDMNVRLSTMANGKLNSFRSGSASPPLRVVNVEQQNFPKTNTSLEFFKDMKLRFLNFKKHKYLAQPEHFQTLSELQSPKFMVIACVDSRVCPSNILGFQPGEAFMVRNVANLVPSFENGPTETNAALEFAVNTLQVENIFVIGHSNCAGIQALMSMEEKNKSSSFIDKWVGKAEVARLRTEAEASHLSFDQQCKHCEKVSIKHSLHNLMSYPWIKERVRKEMLCVHGGYYDFVNCTFEKWTLDSNTYSPKHIELWC
ncbi:Carbonic anhydrase [Euphorbia peplus]|nr:Carbonic anhydrase [Euphorbia peplus]